MPPKDLVGTHLMRVRVANAIWDRLNDTADELSELRGEHVTCSDIVRSACYNWLLVYESTKNLQYQPPPEGWHLDGDEEDEDISIILRPMLPSPDDDDDDDF